MMSAISRPQQDDLMLSGYRASPALPDDRRCPKNPDLLKTT
jgi:hypothetical protein